MTAIQGAARRGVGANLRGDGEHGGPRGVGFPAYRRRPARRQPPPDGRRRRSSLRPCSSRPHREDNSGMGSAYMEDESNNYGERSFDNFLQSHYSIKSTYPSKCQKC